MTLPGGSGRAGAPGLPGKVVHAESGEELGSDGRLVAPTRADPVRAAAVTGDDLTAPDIDGGRRRHSWDISQDATGWHANDGHGLATLHAQSLESLEGKIIRAETAWGAVRAAVAHRAVGALETGQGE
jgi:hypothetical protein